MSDIYNVHTHDLDLKNNHIYLMGVDRGYDVAEGTTDEPGVDFMMANRFIKNMHLCMKINPSRPIVIHMKTNGGDWNEGMAIYDTIKSCPNFVTILNYTHARSMSSIIFSAADRRIMMPHSYFMFHLGTYAIGGEAQTVYSNIDFDKKNSEIMRRIYAELMVKKGKFEGQNLLKVEKWVKDQMAHKGDVFFNAKEAVDYGLADEVFDYDWKNL